MSVLGLFLALAGLAWLALRMTRRQIRLSTLSDAASRQRRTLVGIDQATGKAFDASAELSIVDDGWYPVRFPEGWESRSAGFPSERSMFDRNLDARRIWCETKCRGAWRVERPDSPSPIFWFQDRSDASAFSLTWFPFKCS